MAGLKDLLTTQGQEWSTGIEEWKTKVLYMSIICMCYNSFVLS